MLIGVDIGGTHITAAEIFWKNGKVNFGRESSSSVQTLGSAEDIISSWATVISPLILSHPSVQIGIAMPGPFDYPNGISRMVDQGKMKSLYGLSVKNLLAKELRISPNAIEFTNDAEAFLRGESLGGAGKGFQNALGITLGTGLGSAIQIQEVIRDGMLWTAPFRGGIAEDFLGTNWFKEEVFQRHGLNISGVIELLIPDYEKEIADPLFKEFGLSLGEFLFPYLSRMQMEAVILGGKISESMDRFVPYTLEYLAQMGWEITIEKAQLGENAALLGACFPFLEVNN